MLGIGLDTAGMRELLDGVPHFERFKHVDELEEASRELAKIHTDTVEWRTIGQSSEGRPITALVIGEGNQSVFLYGFTHPNEPIGSLTIEYLALRLASSAELRKRLPYRFILAKAIDVDGAKLNEGWLRGPFDLLTYAENYYRPPPNEQAEWTFPIDYKTLHWNTPIPETRAIKKVVDEFKPEFTYILHNADFCGVYFYLSHALPSAYGELKQIPISEGLPLHRGEPPDELYLETLDEGIYHDYGVSGEYEFLAKTLNIDPATKIDYGTDCYEYIRELYDGFCLTCELPHFYDSRIQNTAPAQHKRRDLLVDSLKIESETHQLVARVLGETDDLLDVNSRLHRSVRYFLTRYDDVQQSTRAYSTAAEFDRPATIGEEFDLTVLKKFAQMPILGTAQRLLRDAQQRTHSSRLNEPSDKVHSRLLQLNDDVRRVCSPCPVPIRKLVRIQLQSALTCLKHLDSRL
ncbi:MAG: M14 family zinc carboxypeptidase [Candidatus Bathyarchaeia archaeon]